MERLIVKNFGPLKDVDIELNKINLFIGENGSGKSVLAKVVTIVLDSVNNVQETPNEIFQRFEDYNINYITDLTLIKFISDTKDLFYLKNKSFKQYLSNEMKQSLDTFNKAKVVLDDQSSLNLEFDELLKEIESLENKNLNEQQSEKLNTIRHKLDKSHQKYNSNVEQLKEFTFQAENTFQKLTAQYIPAERTLISLFSKSLSSLLVADIPLPKFLLKFASEFEKAGNEFKELEVLNVNYVNGDGIDRHKVYFNDEEYLPLENSSSGIQSALPLYVTVKYFAYKHQSIIIEEPEQNLFPKSQAETIKYIIEQVSDDNNLFMMTHSPYVLSTLNILMMAHKVGNLNEEVKKEVEALVPESQWMNRDDFSAYYLENGEARNIKGRTGLISENEIDEVSDDIQFEFEELLTIYREHKNDK